MSRSVHFSYRFHPVGQGLFASGYLAEDGEGAPHFTWVYDCGTSSSQSLVTAGIEALEREFGSRQRIDLLVLSHFDKDHISGVCRLLKQFRVGTLMLPYMPLARRMLLAFEEGSGTAGDATTACCVNPVAFFRAQAGPGIEQILLVPPSDEEGPALLQGVLDGPMDDTDPPKLDFKPARSEDTEDEMALQAAGRSTADTTEVVFLQKGSPITVRSYWEFVPYHAALTKPLAPAFVAEVNARRLELEQSARAPERARALARLKQLYRECFGRDDKGRNHISLHLYAGPIYSSWRRTLLDRVMSTHPVFPRREQCSQPGLPGAPVACGAGKCSILYTGDGTLKKPAHLRRLIQHLHAARMASIAVFQVMHHGSEKNWHEGVAGAIAPRYSLFSSDPAAYAGKHPGAQVLRDFWNHGPVQVDAERGFRAWGILERAESGAMSLRRAAGYCDECWSPLVEVSAEAVPPDDIYYRYHCRECDWGDYTP